MKASYIFTMLFLAMALSLAGCYRWDPLLNKKLKSQISKELPEGSDASKILAFLDENRIKHTDITDVPAEVLDGSRKDSFFNDPKSETKRGRVRKQIAAKVNNSGSGTMEVIYINFYLDGENKLVGFAIDEVGLGVVPLVNKIVIVPHVLGTQHNNSFNRSAR